MARFDQRSEIVGRHAELESLAGFIDSIPGDLLVLLIVGEAGAGKSTLWRAGIAAAKSRSYQVLACAPAEAETHFSYSALGDLINAVPAAVLTKLPAPQRRALEAALLRGEADAPVDERAVAVAFLSTLRLLAELSPVLVAVDDIQWLDGPTARVLAFALRRLDNERVGALVCDRTGVVTRIAADLERDVGARLRRLMVGPLDVAALHHVLQLHLSVSLPRRALLKIQSAAGGNLFYALEIARVLASHALPLGPEEALPVPAPLRELVARRVAALPIKTQEALLAASVLAHPTLELIEAVDRRRQAARILAPAERADLITLDGARLHFTHPLIASAMYAGATPERRRELHQRLAQVVTDVEERARHVALAAAGPSEAVAALLDQAASSARARGAPYSAAELCELAGAATPADRPGARRRRRVDAAECHFIAGDRQRARLLLDEILPGCPPGRERAGVLRILGEVRYHDDSFPEAARLLRLALAEADEDLAARAAIGCDLAYVTHTHEGTSVAVAYAREALAAAEQHGEPALLAEALASVAVTDFLVGNGLDERRLERALALEDMARRVPAPMRPSVIHGTLMSWIGRSEHARVSLERLRSRLVERGDEAALPFLDFLLAFDACARGDIDAAERHAKEGMQAAALTGTETLRAHALTARAVTDAYVGRATSAQQAANNAAALFRKVGCPYWAAWPLSVLGFLHLSSDDAAAAAEALSPLIDSIMVAGAEVPVAASFPPDAVEALVAVGELERAESTLRWFERRGDPENRPWVLATSLRCRGLLLAGRGEVHAGLETLDRALLAHERLPHPVELARTLLVIGRLQRRANRRRQARQTLERALAIFDEVGTTQWAGRTREELTRLGLHRPAGSALTPREAQVARRAAAGAKNREIAAALSMSPKTVEANLARIYRKLGIRSRAELGRLIAEQPRVD